MRLTRLTLQGFRNYDRLELELSPGVVVLQGGNAQGKTNLLEAIFYLATGTSPRAQTDRDLIGWRAEPDTYPLTARMRAELVGGEADQVGLTVIQDQESGRIRKVVQVNGRKRAWRELPGHLRAVLFLPNDVDLVAGPPAVRRRYLDAALGQLNAAYPRDMAAYSRALRQRNYLLKQLRDRSTDLRQLDVWDERLAGPGAALVALRWEAIRSWDGLAGPLHRRITRETGPLHLRYWSALAAASGAKVDSPPPEADPSGLLQGLRERRRGDIQRGATSIGPHRDDLRFLLDPPTSGLDPIDLTIFGSRGQQRTAALALKLAEAEHLEAVRGTEPILLLDDVLSELDQGRRRALLDAIGGAEQAIVTATELRPFPDTFLKSSLLFRVEQGAIRPLSSRTSS